MLRRSFGSDFHARYTADTGDSVDGGDVEFTRPYLLLPSADSQKRRILLHVEVPHNVREFG
jgi:hypothetical protein